MTDPTDVAPAVRAQLLATEHWGLLASRGSTQSEMLSRISMLFTLISAGLVSLALVGQATQFRDTFGLFAILVLAFIAVVGFLTQLRVRIVGIEDLMYVLAMNRLRGAYTAIDPGVGPYFAASPYDDEAGSQWTYDFFHLQGSVRHVAASSMVFLTIVEAALLGLLAGTIARTAAAPLGLSIAVGLVVLVAYFGVFMWLGYRGYRAAWSRWQPLFPSPRPA
jgi:hypothetical protein